MRQCYKCKETKQIDSFYKNKTKKGGYQNICKECHKKMIIENQKANPKKTKEINRRSRIKTKYGIDEEAYNDLLLKQNNACALCGSTDVRRKGNSRLIIDHNHATGEVRGLLCHPCNRILGMIKDSKEWALNAVEYL